MANYSCRNGHSWEGKSSLSRSFHPGELRCPEDGCGLPAEPKMKAGGSGPGLSGQPESRVLADAHTRFSCLVTEWPCFFLGRRDMHTCWPARANDPHHLVPASWIKSTFSELPDVELGDILYAPIIGVSLCRKAHDAVELRSDFIYWHELDDEAKDFCKRIDEKYPGRPSMLARLELESPKQEAAPPASERSSA